ncbi:methyltransferase domain-containing protein [Modestobacter sp. I12A-02628]|uniref:Class I SAM-dependent methyltransferase n=1 Tax=Goekera deserti TaxID=2497753 RepID=A0A7K3WC11_9ACTN|nr:class I SAM-dependent methyltransferase [Goekera deserti]MPQ98416.1 methyltransferase domain-containing protein [Goekera deserti]NDI48243.1 methyltransferase domain-containing protein [Goekera deserti]NEL53992.1 class I SAM-dependent methyltransferase [Goekera deserti]
MSTHEQGHRHEHGHGTAPEDRPGGTGSDLASWEERYGGAPALWSGQVNATLVTHTAGLTPGHALDVGCGEGGDVLWLAGQGWRVTGLDWSQVALARAAEHAAAAGLADRVEWVRGDVDTWQPPADTHDLVTAHFLHPTEPQRHRVLARLAASVAPGGTLLWVGHPFDADAAAVWGADRFAAASEVAADLDPQVWEVLLAEQQPRPGGGEGQRRADEVLRARRR